MGEDYTMASHIQNDTNIKNRIHIYKEIFIKMQKTVKTVKKYITKKCVYYNICKKGEIC